MKRIILSLAGAILLTSAASAQVHVGAGYTMSTSTYQSRPEADVNNTPAHGFYAGLGYEFSIIKGLSVAPGLYYSYLYSADASDAALGTILSGSYKTQLKEHYLNLPITVNFGYNLVNGLRLFAFGGPTFSLGLSSATHYDTKVSIVGIDINDSGDVDNYAGTTESPADYGRFDILLGIGAGADIAGKFRITVGYDWGLLNRNVDANSTAIRHRKQLRAGVAYLF